MEDVVQQGLTEEEVEAAMEEMDRMFDERFDFDPHPATRKAWRSLLEDGVVRVSRDDGPQGYRIIAELDYLAGMVGAETFAGPYIVTYVLADEITHMNLPDYYTDDNMDSLDASARHMGITEEIQEKVSWVSK